MIICVEMPSGARSRGYRCGAGSRKEQDRVPEDWFHMVSKQLDVLGAATLMLDGEKEIRRRSV